MIRDLYLCRCKCGKPFASVYPTTVYCRICVAALINATEDGYASANAPDAMDAYDGFDSPAIDGPAADTPQLKDAEEVHEYDLPWSLIAENQRVFGEFADSLWRKTGHWHPALAGLVIALSLMALGALLSAGQADAQGWGQQ